MAKSEYKTLLLRPSMKPNSIIKHGSFDQSIRTWSPDVNMLVSSSRWLEMFGLRNYKLEMKQILSKIGFKQSEDYVKSLQRLVSASYSKGLFPQYACEDGTKYNLLDSSDKLKEVDTQLQRVLEFYHERLKWLTTSSRLMFGVIEERTVTIVLDFHTSTEVDRDVVKYSLFSLVKEQLIHLKRFNFISCAQFPIKWQRASVEVSLESIEKILDWIYDIPCNQSHDEQCVIDALVEASEDEVEAILLCTDGTCFEEIDENFRKNVKDLSIPVHIIAMNCKLPSALHELRETAIYCQGRFHKFKFSTSDHSSAPMNERQRGPESMTIVDHSKMQAKLEVGKQVDVIEMKKELGKTRENLATVRRIQQYLSQQRALKSSSAEQEEKAKQNKEKIPCETYMGSKEWLKKHSLDAKKLGFYDVLKNMAFKHCDGVIDVPNHHGDGVISPPVSKLVHAKYCEKFAHVRWKDGEIRHVHVTSEVYENYKRRISAVLDSYYKRIQWLRRGSRELFGTIIEDQVTILIDTSASMRSRLSLVKEKLHQLLQEQIKHKRKFNLIHFDSSAIGWRSRIVDCTEQSISDAWLWVKGLKVGGSTNTLAALKLALADELCEAIYLLTDGRPDQPTSTILAQIHLRDPIPIHTISFNCSDETANEFLRKLSEQTRARFHYFSEDEDAEDCVKTYESEDIRLIKDEIDKGSRDLERLTRLREWCAKLDWVSNNVKENMSPPNLTSLTKKQSSTLPLLKSNERPSKPRVVGRINKTKTLKKVENSVSSSENVNLSSSEEDIDDKKIEKNHVDDDDLSIRQASYTNDEEETKKSAKEIDDDRVKAQITKSTEEVDDDNKKKKMHKKLKVKQKKDTRRKVIPHSCIKDNLPTVDKTNTRANTDSSINKPKKPTDQPKTPWVRNHRVLARNNVDGFYYPGILRVNINPRYGDVSFNGMESQVVSLRHIIPNEGSRPCPTLKIGDYVLVKLVRSGRPSCYVPGVVYVVPLRQSKETKYYTIIHYNRFKTTALRKDIVKISQSRYAFSCRYIKDCEVTANESTTHDGVDGDQEQHDQDESSNRSRSPAINSSISEDGKQTNSERMDNDNDSKNKALNSRHDSGYDDLTTIRQQLFDTHKLQLKSIEEQQKRFEELQREIKVTMDEQTKLQENLKGHYDKIKNRNIDDTSVNSDVIDDEVSKYKKLFDEKQAEIMNDLKKHNKLLEQLVHPPDQVSKNQTENSSNAEKLKKKKHSREKKMAKGKSNSSNDSTSSNNRSSSDEDNKKSAISQPAEKNLSKPQDDGMPSKIKFSIQSDACLWTKGPHGLLISRAPLEKDPAVAKRRVPLTLQKGEEVLARWSDDGWYYRGTVHEDKGGNYLVEDSVGNMEEISREDIITDDDDSPNSLKVNDAVIALHPSFSFSYAPGIIVDVKDQLLYNVRFYDGRENIIPREELYLIAPEKFSFDVDYIVRREESLVGKAVVARNDGDGLFYLGNVCSRVGNGRQYVVQWPDWSSQVQSSSMIFGAHTKRHQLAEGDKVLALNDTAKGLYKPGIITGGTEKSLTVKFTGQEKTFQVDPLQCFWLSNDYYERAEDYIAQLH
ncbi:von Willebrand factor A domain-containing protein 3B-like isoform X2 [Xenia sp. Carnegie-2017]|uniref:von Willebrand factor A domain-containing protein 3B-like isoform X2 n=1 Tax=Xenia sp. Carnegie-2017 TaxID=2897299 RepID=UPI001F04C975|nr:von Willebrand factor A domain-containing protein 3B-like isoform X2 [Xenia sp. Carnegie-2017]